MKHVIIGAGAAGIAAAKKIRELSAKDEIVIISSDEYVTSRCMLHMYISGERGVEELSFVPENFFKDYKIKWIGGLTVREIDYKAKIVNCDSGAAIGYDKLLIATGARSSIPPVGALRTAGNVFGLRNFPDARSISEAAAGSDKIVIIGAGLVGLDAAYALIEQKKDVSIIDIIPRVLPVNLDERSALEYQKRFEAAGCRFYLGVAVSGTSQDDKGNITEIILGNGEILPCDLVIAAAGVNPASDLVDASAKTDRRFIRVNEYMETGIEDVYAAGDVAGLSGIWPNATRQGEIAGSNMLGKAIQYTDTFAVKNTVNFFGLVTLSLGKFEPDEGDKVETREDRRGYRKVITRDGVVLGVVLQGDISNSGFWQHLIKNAIKIDGIGKSVWKLSYADFCGLDETGEYVWKTS